MSAPAVVDQCIFCNIVSGQQAADVVYQNESVIVFRDIRPAAKNHILAVPKEHLKDSKALLPEHKPVVSDLVSAANEGLKLLGDDLSDVRYGFHYPPFNSISHLHLHAISPSSEMRFLSRMVFKENSFWFVSPEYVVSTLENKA